MAAGVYQRYLARLRALYGEPESAPELSLRPALQDLLDSMVATIPGGLVIPEGREHGRPDFIIKAGPVPVGYVEVKAPGASLVADTEQLRRYVSGLPNLIITDYDRFELWRDQINVESAGLGIRSMITGEVPIRSISTNARHAVETLLNNFVAYHPRPLNRPEQLAIALASRARVLRFKLHEALADASNTSLRRLYDFFSEHLYPEISETVFVDTVAQTVCYALFLARLSTRDPATFTSRNARFLVPENVPFLRTALHVFADEDELPSSLQWLIQDIVELLRLIDAASIHAGFERGTQSTDAFLYFYEPFLRAYDRDERIERGVYYTPSPLVDFIVRAVDSAIRQYFGRPRGLADRSVTVLDPAVGTGTFLVATIDRIAERVAEIEGSGAVPSELSDHVLPRLFGFEFLPAPYTIAHLRLAALAKSYNAPLADDQRLNVYLTNTLRPPFAADPGDNLPILQSLVEEVRAADHTKASQPILVVLGNPPYERNSRHNRGLYIDSMVDDFTVIDGEPLGERNSRSIRDDYVKFFRWSMAKLLELPSSMQLGIVAFVTNNGFVDGVAFRGMRRWMLDRFDRIYIFNLHGDQREWIRGRRDEKIFTEVQAGIAITVAIRNNPGAQGGAWYQECRGTRDDKFAKLSTTSLTDGDWERLDVRAPDYFFVPDRSTAAYRSWPRLPDLFPQHGTGVQTSADGILVANDAAGLADNFRRLNDAHYTDEQLIEHFRLRRRSQQDRLRRLRRLHPVFNAERVRPYLYRQLDYRVLYFSDQVVYRPHHEISDLLDSTGNIAIVTARHRRGGDGQGATVTTAITDLNVFGSGVYLYPRLSSAESRLQGLDPERTLNLRQSLVQAILSAGLTDRAEAIFYYILAIAASRAFGESFGDPLSRNHPRIPITQNVELFQELSELGVELARLNLLRLQDDELSVTFSGSGTGVLRPPVFLSEQSTVEIGNGLRIEAVTEAAWRYKIGQYFTIERYLTERVGQRFSAALRDQIRVVCSAIKLTLPLMSRVDELVRQVIVQGTFSEGDFEIASSEEDIDRDGDGDIVT